MEALSIVKREICPGRPHREIAECIATNLLSSYNSAMAVQVTVSIPRGFFKGLSKTDLQVFKERSSEDIRDLHNRGRRQYEYMCYCKTDLTVMIGEELQGVLLRINTKEIPYVSISSNERQGERIRNTEASKTSHLHDPTSSLTYPIFNVIQSVLKRVEQRSYNDMQALGQYIAKLAFQQVDESHVCNHLLELTTRGSLIRPMTDKHTLGKKEKMRSVVENGRCLTRLERSEYKKSKNTLEEGRPANSLRRAYIAIGSNVGDRLGMAEAACLEMDRCGVHVARTSGLYETEAMYLRDQQSFLNGACEVSIKLEWKTIRTTQAFPKLTCSIGRDRARAFRALRSTQRHRN